MPRFREKIETKRFLRRLAEARRRYGGEPRDAGATLDCQADDAPWSPRMVRPRGPNPASPAPGQHTEEPET